MGSDYLPPNVPGPRVPPQLQDELRALAARYFTSADRQDGELYASCFTTDGVLSIVRAPGEEPVVRQGQTVLKEVVVGLHPFVRTFHQMGQATYRYADDASGEILSEVYCTAHHISGQPPQDLVMYIRYHDRYRLEDDEWKIAQRTINCDFKSSQSGVHHVNPLAGQQVSAAPA